MLQQLVLAIVGLHCTPVLSLERGWRRLIEYHVPAARTHRRPELVVVDLGRIGIRLGR